MNPPINFLPWRQQRRTAFLRFWLLMFVAPLLLAVGITLILRLTGSAEARIDAVLLQGEQQLAHSLQITKPRLLEQQQLRRTAFAKAAPATIYPRLAICAGSTGGAFTRARLADNDKLAAGNAGDQGADNKHYRVKPH
ncbi:putative fimbrial assembly protein [Escherichia coli]|uniref:Putative fimbrial assembly protein n=1 Tax=Escherichia coli TaxID=562 RepID=A0A377C837_ECOLX|nr:putative fimbrial assembly protein [Escherichia coli]